MAVGVVDGFEVVDVHEKDGEGCILFAGLLALGIEKRHDVTAVEELGDGIDDGGEFELRESGDVFGSLQGEGAYGGHKDGGGEEYDCDEPVFLVIAAVGGIEPQEDRDPCGGENGEYAQEAPCGTSIAGRQHGADAADRDEGG